MLPGNLGLQPLPKSRQALRAPRPRQPRQPGRVLAVLESHGLGGENMFEEFNVDDKDYVNVSLLRATEVKCGSEGFAVHMADGSILRCAHNQPQGTRLPDYAPQPAMVLKIEDGSNILLPLIVLEGARTTLMDALRNSPLSRPTMYVVVRDMIELMGYELRLVRITHRVSVSYFAKIYLSKVGDESGNVISLDLMPSDAINMAVRAKVPIQVNKALAVSDGVRQVSMVARGSSRSIRPVRSYHFNWTDEDRPDVQDATTAAEFALVKLMEAAALEERFADAARIRDQLNELRARVIADNEE